MRIVHMADSHLGFSAYGRVDQWGRNLREECIYEGFKKTIDKIIDEIQPDAVIHSGDVFHHVRPRIRPLYIFKRELERLIKKDIPVIIISGNHDAPKSSATLSPFILYEGLKNVYIAHDEKYKCFEIDDFNFHCIPFCLDPDKYVQEFRNINYSGNDVLVMHGLVEALWHKRLKTVGEHQIRESLLNSSFSYIALGHYHGQAQVARNAWYCGSVEYFRFSEAKDKKGILLVDLDSKKVTQIPIVDDYMRDLDPIDCNGLSSKEIEDLIRSLCDDLGLKDKIVRLRLSDLSRVAYRSLSQRLIGELRAEALHLEILPKFSDEPVRIETEAMGADDLPKEFRKFIEVEAADGGIPETIRKDVLDYGIDLLTRISEKRTTESFDVSK